MSVLALRIRLRSGGFTEMMNVRRVIRSTVVALIAAVTFTGTTQTANAAPPDKLADVLAELWTTVLQTPSDANPFSNPDANACWDLGANIVAPLGPTGVDACTVKPGTRLFVAGSTLECSTPWEAPPGTDLQQCARANDAPEAPTVTLDGRPVSLTEVTTDVTPVTLPEDNVFGSPDRQGQFAAHGWVALLKPLTPGSHTIEIATDDPNNPITTVIEVVPPGRA
jgi:hypothetical protein